MNAGPGSSLSPLSIPVFFSYLIINQLPPMAVIAAMLRCHSTISHGNGTTSTSILLFVVPSPSQIYSFPPSPYLTKQTVSRGCNPACHSMSSERVWEKKLMCERKVESVNNDNDIEHSNSITLVLQLYLPLLRIIFPRQ